jgi:hypothetical protein
MAKRRTLNKRKKTKRYKNKSSRARYNTNMRRKKSRKRYKRGGSDDGMEFAKKFKTGDEAREGALNLMENLKSEFPDYKSSEGTRGENKDAKVLSSHSRKPTKGKFKFGADMLMYDTNTLPCYLQKEEALCNDNGCNWVFEDGQGKCLPKKEKYNFFDVEREKTTPKLLNNILIATSATKGSPPLLNIRGGARRRRTICLFF